MTQVTKYIERFLCVLTPSAEIKVIQLDEVTAIDGVAAKSHQVGATSITDPKVSALLDAVSAKTHADLIAERAALSAMTAERDTLQTQVDTIPGLTVQIETLTAEKADLEAEVARLTALVPPDVDVNGVPAVITCVQGRLALLQAGLLDAVESSISEASREVRIFWEFAVEWHRTNAVLVSLGQSLGLSDLQVDDLFRLAKGL
jgi:hypothetical protein